MHLLLEIYGMKISDQQFRHMGSVFFFHFEVKQLWKWKNERVNGLEQIYSIPDATKLTKVIHNFYHKLYRQLDIPRTEDSLTEIKKTKQNKTITKRKQLWAPLKEVSHTKFMNTDWFYWCVF